MKTTKLIFIIMCFMPTMLMAQSTTSERAERDLQASCEVLKAMIFKEYRRILPNDNQVVQGIYNKGIVYSIIGHINRPYIMLTDFKHIGAYKVISSNKEKTKKNKKKKVLIRHDAFNDSIDKFYSNNTKAICEKFVTNYHIYFNHISANDSIRFIYKMDKFPVDFSFEFGHEMNDKSYSIIEIGFAKKDIDNYVNGKTKSLPSKLTSSTKKVSDFNNQDCHILHTVLENSVNKMLDIRPTRYLKRFNYIKDLGVIFWLFNKSKSYVYDFRTSNTYVRFLSPSKHIDIFDNSSKTIKRDTTKSSKYDNFIKHFKQDIIEYGRTLKSLEKEEYLFIRIEHFNQKSKLEDAPKNIEFAVKKAILSDYNAQKISLDEAIKKVKLRAY